ncbi:MAG: radical SAM protein, partial [Methanocella sp.]
MQPDYPPVAGMDGEDVTCRVTMKKILLIPPPSIFMGRYEPHIPLGLLSLRAMARDLGGNVDVLPLSERQRDHRFTDIGHFIKALLDGVDLSEYDIVGLSTMSNSFHRSLRIARAIRRDAPGAQVLMGGPYVFGIAREVLEAFRDIDAIFVGEGERAFADLLVRRRSGRGDLTGVPGILTRGSEFVPAPAICDLDELPLIPPDDLYQGYLSHANNQAGERIAPLEVSRGCPGACAFCSTRLFWGRVVRRKSDARIMAEMRLIRDHTSLSQFELIGDNFGSPRREFMRFCRAMAAAGGEFDWHCNLKLDHVAEEDLETIWRGGCRGFNAGVESSSQETLNRIKKGVKIDKEVRTIRRAIARGFKVNLSFIVGFPWETTRDLDATFRLACDLLEAGAERVMVGALTPLPGTDLTRAYPIRFDR